MKDAILQEIRRNRKGERLPDPSEYNEKIREGWMPFWAKNSRRLARYIEEAYMVEEAPEAAYHIQKNSGDEAFIIGSGPSLDKALPHLKTWKGDIWCSSSQLAVLEAYDITPTYCVVIDADPTQTFLVSEAKTKDITLITHPCMELDVLEAWDGPVVWFLMRDPGDPFFSEILPLMYDGLGPDGKDKIRSYVMNSGCVVNTIVGLSLHAQYKHIFLAGVDLGFPNGQYRFTNYKRLNGGYTPIPDPGIPETRKSYITDGIWTDTVGVFYKYSFFVLYGVDNPNCISCSDGLLRELPHMSAEDACNGVEPPVVDRNAKYDRSQAYLRRRGLFIMKRKRQTLLTIKNSPKRYKRMKRLVLRYTVLVEKWHKRPYLHVIRGMLVSETVRINIKKLIIMLDPNVTTVGFDGYVTIQNVQALPKMKRLPFKMKYYIGKMMRQW